MTMLDFRTFNRRWYLGNLLILAGVRFKQEQQSELVFVKAKSYIPLSVQAWEWQLGECSNKQAVEKRD